MMRDLPEPPDAAVSERLLPGFRAGYVETGGARIRVLRKGEGPPVLLLHGHPETHVMWHKIAPRLAEDYSVVLTDLRGYGDSSKPEGGVEHVNYSFREMGRDQVQVMRQLGHGEFLLAGHDRGGRVAARMCMDYPEAIRKVALLDIAPTLTMYEATTQEFATKYVWWFLLIQPEPLPERLITGDAEFFMKQHLEAQSDTPGCVAPEAMAEYLRCYCCTRTIRAICEDYRAAAGIGLEMDRADRTAGRKIEAPVLALWGAKGTVGKLWDVIAAWRNVAREVSGKGLDCGHLLAEERPEEVLRELRGFFQA